MTRRLFLAVMALAALFFGTAPGHGADRVRFAYPAKSLNYLPITM